MLGQGGMAAVFRGENLLDSAIVRAIKVVHPWLAEDPVFAKRFAEEARVLEQLQHPNIVRFYGVRREGDQLLMELELLEGEPLSNIIRQAGEDGIPVQSAVNMIAQAARGLAVAHGQGVVHRDLKPDNLFLTNAGHVKILDFGLARALDEAERAGSLTRTGAVPCTPAYLAPEVCQQAKPSRASDVYALGMTLYEMLMGRHPLISPGSRPSPMEFMFAQVQQELPPLSESRPDLPAGLVEVAVKATAKKPGERYQDGAELLRALESSGLPGSSGVGEVGAGLKAGDSGVATLIGATGLAATVPGPGGLGTTSLTQGELGEATGDTKPASARRGLRRGLMAGGILLALAGAAVWTVLRLADADDKQHDPQPEQVAAMQSHLGDAGSSPDLAPPQADLVPPGRRAAKGKARTPRAAKKKRKRVRKAQCGSFALNHVFKDIGAIRKVLEKNKGALRRCMTGATSPTGKRQVYAYELQFSIKGNILTMDPVTMQESTKALQACMFKYFSGLPWPKPRQQGVVRVLCQVD